jgi:hypothetical protein
MGRKSENKKLLEKFILMRETMNQSYWRIGVRWDVAYRLNHKLNGEVKKWRINI